MKNLKFLVTGTGRCGTVYLAKFLTSIGVPCCHEGVFNYDIKDVAKRIQNSKIRNLSKCSMNMAMLQHNLEPNVWVDVKKTVADSSYLAVPFLEHPSFKNIPILHVVRHPMDVISSFVLDLGYFSENQPHNSQSNNWGEVYEKIIWDTTPEIAFPQTQLERACWYYYEWNKIIEDAGKNRNYMRINIENFDKEAICDFVGGKKELIQSSFDDKKANTNKYRNFEISINDIPSGFFKQLIIKKAKDYGYELEGIIMSDLSDALNRLSDVIKEVALVVDEPLNSISVKPAIKLNNVIKEVVDDPVIKSLNIIDPQKDDFESLKALLESDKWPVAIDPEEICDVTNEEDKNERGIGISEILLSDYQGKKVLDYGCGEGHIIKNSKNLFMGVGYDIQKTGNLNWEEVEGNSLLTTDFDKVRSYGTYDVVLLYDVLDHVSDPNNILKDIKSVSNKDTLIIARCHPWCSRHGAHLYNSLNKAFIHVVFSDEELANLGLTSNLTVNIAPLNHYRNLFSINNLTIKSEKIEKTEIEKFFQENLLVRKRIMNRWNRDAMKEFPTFQLEQSFVDYVLV